MVTSDEKTRYLYTIRPTIFWEHIIPRLGYTLQFLYCPSSKKIPCNEYGINFFLIEQPKTLFELSSSILVMAMYVT